MDFAQIAQIRKAFQYLFKPGACGTCGSKRSLVECGPKIQSNKEATMEPSISATQQGKFGGVLIEGLIEGFERSTNNSVRPRWSAPIGA